MGAGFGSVAVGRIRLTGTPFGWLGIGTVVPAVTFGLADVGASRPADATPISKDQAPRA
jgi:hypothetical protein